MCALQVLWLCAIWTTGVTSAGSTPLWLAVGAVACLLAIAVVPIPSRLAMAGSETDPVSTALPLVMLCLGVASVGVVYAVKQGPLPDEDSAVAAVRIITTAGVGRFFDQYAHIDWLGTRHPPLVPLIFAVFAKLFGSTLVVLRLVSLGFLLATLPVTCQLGRELYDYRVGILAALALVMMPYMFRVGVAARTDMAVTLFGSIALLYTLRLVDRPGWLPVGGAGVGIGLAVLSKYSAFLMLPVLALLLVWRRASWDAWRRLAGAMIVSGVVVLPWLVFALRHGVFAAQLQTVVLFVGGPALDQGAVHHHSALRFQLELLMTSLPSGIGVDNLALILPGAWMLARRHRTSDGAVLIWIGGIVALLLLVLPDPRYFMLTFPALAVLMAGTLNSVRSGTTRVVALGFLYCGEALYLYTAAARTAVLFGR